MKKFLLVFLLVLVALPAAAQTPAPEDYFIITVKQAGVHEPVEIRTNPAYSYNYTVDWGDGNIEQGITGNIVHHYYSVNTYTVKISGLFPQYYNNDQYNPFLRSIEQWGRGVWKSMARSFKNCRGLKINTMDKPNLTQVTDMSEMFFQASEFGGDLSDWDVSNVKNMSKMFYQCYLFNTDITNWNTASLQNASFMFFEAEKFNQDIGNWNTSQVTNMQEMLAGAKEFNQNIGRWDMSNVTNIENMLRIVPLSTANYDALLKGWSTRNLKPGLTLNAYNATYCTAVAERAVVRSKWTIWNDTQNCNGGISCTGSVTTYTGTWSNGLPTPTKKAVFAANYNTTAGSIDACSIQINPGFTLTVAPGTTIKVQNDLAINGNLIFQSSASGNGELAKLGPKAAIVGNATVQRYMKAKRSYRMVSPAVSTSTSIMANWQEGVNNTPTSGNLNPNPGFGTHITGNTTGANGLDATGTGNPSMYTVNTVSQQFQVVTNTNSNKLEIGHAYLMMVRGDRSTDLSNNNAPATPTVLRAKGKLAWGQKHQKYVSPNPGAFVMFGNPYQSAVNINTVFATSTNVNKNFYYVYDPNIGTMGAYVTVYLPGGNNNNGGTLSVPPSAANQYLQAGQGGQLATLSAGSVTIDFTESDKAPGQFTATNATGNTLLEDGMLMGQLYTQENYDNAGPVHDAFALIFAEGNENELTSMDAKKPFNFYENIGIDQNGTYLSVEKRALPQAGEIFNLYTVGYQTNDYVLKMEVNGLEDATIYLEDQFTGTSTLMENNTIAYPFSIDASNVDSMASDRFSIRVAERLSVEQNTLATGITFYPNPMTDQLNVGNPNNLQLDSASIYDITGRLIKTVDLKGATSEVMISVSNLSSATYMVVITGESGQVSKLLVKE